MKIALCFWGLTRSLKYTIKSIREHILNVLQKSNEDTSNEPIEYTIFLHTYQFKSTYYNPRAKEVGVNLNFNEYKLIQRCKHLPMQVAQ